MDASIELLGSMASRYADLMSSSEWAWESMAWTVFAQVDVVGLPTMPSSTDFDVVDTLGLEEFLELAVETQDQSSSVLAWMITSDRAIGFLEPAGFGAAETAFSAVAATQGLVVAGMRWNVNSVNRLSVRRPGHAADGFELGVGDVDREAHPALGGYWPLLQNESGWWQTGLAVVETETGLKIDDLVLDARWPVVRLAFSEDDASAPAGQDSDTAFLELFASAPDDTKADTRYRACELAVDANRLKTEPCVVPVLQTIAENSVVDRESDLWQQLWDLGYKLQELNNSETNGNGYSSGDPSNPAWLKLQAARALRAFGTTRSSLSGDVNDRDGWLHIANALQGRWPRLRAQLAGDLRRRHEQAF